MASSSSSTQLDPQATLSSTSRRLRDLQTFQLTRLQECRGPLGLFHELADEMRGDLQGVRRSIELCKELGETLGGEKGEYLGRTEELERQYHDLRRSYREALVSTKRNITSSARSRRHELLISRNSNDELGEPSKASHKAAFRAETGGDDALQTKTNEVTDALRRTTQLMQAELERSVLSVQMLDESTRTIRLTQTLYDNYTSLLTTSGQLVKAIEKADWYDRLLIFSAFSFFLLVVGWVIKRRVLDKVMGGVGWWVGGSWKLVKMGLGAGGGAKERNDTTSAVTAAVSSAIPASVALAAKAASSAAADVKAAVGGTPDTNAKGKVEIRQHGDVVAVPEGEDTILDTVVPPDSPSPSAVSDQRRVVDEL